jgi:hypothetical protein
LRALKIAIACGLVACEKPSSPPDEQGPRKPRVELIVWLDPHAEVPPDDVVVTTAAPPKSRQMFERSGLRMAVVGLPPGADVEKAARDARDAGSNATVFVSTGCLKDLQLGLEKNLVAAASVAVAIGARCDGSAKPRVAAAALVEAGSASRVRIIFDRNTRSFLKVEPIP